MNASMRSESRKAEEAYLNNEYDSESFKEK